jgi:hypothetical protein
MTTWLGRHRGISHLIIQVPTAPPVPEILNDLNENTPCGQPRLESTRLRLCALDEVLRFHHFPTPQWCTHGNQI